MNNLDIKYNSICLIFSNPKETEVILNEEFPLNNPKQSSIKIKNEIVVYQNKISDGFYEPNTYITTTRVKQLVLGRLKEHQYKLSEYI